MEELKKHGTRFTALEMRRKLKVKKTTQWRYHQQLLESNHIKKVRKKGDSLVRYEVTDPDEYRELEETISKALKTCLDKILVSGDSPRSTVPRRSTAKMERATQRKRAS